MDAPHPAKAGRDKTNRSTNKDAVAQYDSVLAKHAERRCTGTNSKAERCRMEIHREVHHELADIEDEIAHHAGSYTYLCAFSGVTFFAHHPYGRVLRHIPHTEHVNGVA